MPNNPEGNSIYILDNLGITTECRKNGSIFPCDNVIYGKKPIYDTSTGTVKLCDIDITTGDYIYNNKCIDSGDTFYIESVNNTCYLADSKKSDYIQKNIPSCCMSNILCKEGDEPPINETDNRPILNPGYRLNREINRDNIFTCKNGECILIPSDYQINPNRYPDIKSAIEKKGIFYSNQCNCVLNTENCKNGNCEPKSNCDICYDTPEISPATPLKKYTCNKGNCVEDLFGPYLNLDTCQNSCGTVNFTEYIPINIEKIVTTYSLFFILGVLIIYFILLFFEAKRRK